MERNTANALRRTWIQFCGCNLFPLIQIICAFQSYQDSGSVQTACIQVVCTPHGISAASITQVVFLAVCTLLLTDQNALRIRRAALLAFGVHTAGTGFMWFKIVRWHVCSAMLYTSLIDHLQDSLFILACTSLAGNAGFGQTVGITLISAVALCCKLMWCRLHLENRRSIEGEPEQSLFASLIY